MRWVETSGKTVQEAKRKAARELGVPEHEIEFEVLEVGSKGLLGFLGGTPARVRATHYESTSRHIPTGPISGSMGLEFDRSLTELNKTRARARRRPRGKGGQEAARRDQIPQKPAAEAKPEERAERPERRERSRRSQRQKPAAEAPKQPVQPEPQPQPQAAANIPAQQTPEPQAAASGTGSSRRRRRRSRRPRTEGAQAQVTGQTAPEEQVETAAAPAASRPSAQAERPAPARLTPKAEGDEKVMEAIAAKAVEIVQGILDAGELGCHVKVAELTGDGVEIEIEGGKCDLLVGRQGQALDALQFLVGVIVNRSQQTKVRLTLETCGFRRKHREMLVKTATELAGQVKEHQQEAELEPLPARDRLIIHNALKEHPDVYTYSEGEGDSRHVVISPKTADNTPAE